MNPTASRSAILDTVITFQDIVRLKESLDSAIARLYDTKVTVDDVFSACFTHDEATLLRSESNSLEISQKITHIQQYLSQIKKELNSLPVVELELAYRPVERVEKIILQNLKSLLGQDIILHIIVNPLIIAGAILHFKGKTYDYSFQKEVDLYFSKSE